MTPKQKSKELIQAYQMYVNGYVGSSMLSNTEYPEAILNNAKKCALIAVKDLKKYTQELEWIEGYTPLAYWQQVEIEIEKTEVNI